MQPLKSEVSGSARNAEREEVRKMVNKAKNLNDQEKRKFMHLIRGMQMIKVKRKTESQEN